MKEGVDVKNLKKKSKARKILLSLLIVILIIFLALSFSVAIYIKNVTNEKLDLSLFKIDSAHSATKIYTMVDGEWLEWREERILGEHNFEFVSFDDVPKDFWNNGKSVEFVRPSRIILGMNISAEHEEIIHKTAKQCGVPVTKAECTAFGIKTE